MEDRVRPSQDEIRTLRSCHQAVQKNSKMFSTNLSAALASIEIAQPPFPYTLDRHLKEKFFKSESVRSGKDRQSAIRVGKAKALRLLKAMMPEKHRPHCGNAHSSISCRTAEWVSAALAHTHSQECHTHTHTGSQDHFK